MGLSETLLRAACRPPRSDDYHAVQAYQVPGQELSLLRREFPDFSGLVRGKRVLDYGCGEGRQALALVREEGCTVCGVDTRAEALEQARLLAAAARVGADRLWFVEHASPDLLGAFDVVISQNAMEHFADPRGVLGQMARLIHGAGRILITFGPPWLAPYGSHMQFFCKVPWVNVFFPEDAVLRVRSRYRSDGARRYEDVEAGLNRMTVAKFEAVVRSSGMLMESKRYTCVKRADWLARVPGLREFVVNQLTCVLRHAPTRFPPRGPM